MTRVLITVGNYNSKAAIILINELIEAGVKVDGLIVIRRLNVKRIFQMSRSYGLSFMKSKLLSLLGPGKRAEIGLVEKRFKEISTRTNTLGKLIKLHNMSVCKANTLNSSSVVKFINSLNSHYVVYSGGGIFSKFTLDGINTPVINAHLGKIPNVRGMNAAEWSFLLGQKPLVSVHIIDYGIDTGKVLVEQEYNINNVKSVLDLRERALLAGISATLYFLAHGENCSNKDNITFTRHCYVMSSLFTLMCNKRLREKGKIL